MLLRFCISRDSHHAGFFANCLLYNTTCFTTYRRGGLPPLQAQNHTPPKSSQARQISRGEPHQPCKIGETATPTASLLQPGAEGEQPPPSPPPPPARTCGWTRRSLPSPHIPGPFCSPRPFHNPGGGTDPPPPPDPVTAAPRLPHSPLASPRAEAAAEGNGPPQPPSRPHGAAHAQPPPRHAH